MLKSLRSRLLLVVVAVGIVAIGATAAIAQQVATDDMRATIDRRVETRTEVLDALWQFVSVDGSWDGAEDFVQTLADQYDERVAVYDTSGEVIADSNPDAELPSFPIGVIDPPPIEDLMLDAVLDHCLSELGINTGPDSQVSIVLDEPAFNECMDESIAAVPAQRSGRVYVGTGQDNAASVLGPNGPNGRIVAVAILVLLGAIVVMAFALRPVLAPIGALRNGARRLEEGYLDTRVPETGATELVELAQSFNSMAAALQEDKERQQRWTSDTAHELRNPVQNLRGHLEAAKDGLMVPDDEWLDSMLDEAGQLSHLVADLGVLTLSDAGQIALQRDTVDLGDVVADVVTSHRARAAQADVSLTATGSATVEGDARRLRQVISNLVDNALRHTPAGGSVTVEVSGGDSAATGTSAAIVKVVDTGEGIPADAQDRVFDRFARVDEHRARHAGGSGLGLSIVAALVDAHGGRVSVDSEQGVGSTFTLTLPAAGDPQPGVGRDPDADADDAHTDIVLDVVPDIEPVTVNEPVPASELDPAVVDADT